MSDKKCVTDFEQFFKDNYQRMYFLAYGLLHDGELSKDVVSSAFEELVARFDELDATRRAGYLYSVVRNKCAAYYRKQAAHDNYAQHYLAHAERSQSIDLLEHQERMEAIQHAIDQLPARNRQILMACFYSGKHYAEIGDEYGITEDCVKKHVAKAIRALRTKIVKTIDS